MTEAANGLRHSWLQTTAIIAALTLTAAGTLVAVTLWIDSSNQRIALLEEEHREDVQAIAALTAQLRDVASQFRDVNAQMSRINETASLLNTSMQLVAQKLSEKHAR